MKSGKALLLIIIIAALGVVIGDLLYASRFVPRFKEIEKQRIVQSNQLATAKIVSENLNHVRDLVFRNIEFPNQKDTVSQESLLFAFLTESVNDLKMRLISVRPKKPTVTGLVTTQAYEIELEGDFFSLGEFFAKLENSRRALAVTSFEVSLQSKGEDAASPKGKPASSARRPVLIRLHLEAYRLRKG